MPDLPKDDADDRAIESLLTAVVMLLVDQRSRSVSPGEKLPPVEFMLSDAGLDNRLIAQIIGKKPDAVRMALSRRGS